MDTGKAMLAADRAAIAASACQIHASSVDGTSGPWIAVWDPQRGHYEQA
jgi:hypothetical protein